MSVKKNIIAVLLAFLFLQASYATHNRAGEITYRQIDALSFEITIWTYTYTLSIADRDELPVDWGDGTSSIAPRVNHIELPNYYRKNKYVAIHTFPGPGVYKIVVQDPNRNFGVVNIPNSVNVVFSIQTTLMINPEIGQNNTPLLLNPPFDKAAIGRKFVHNPAAFDEDGDSLSYSLTVCTREDGLPIENYSYPVATDTLYVDARTGDLVWDSPIDSGFYNVAMNIEEWRKGVKIGNLVRDMQINVYNTDNNPPETDSLSNYCVVAGDSIEMTITSYDSEGDSIFHYPTGGIFFLDDSPAEFNTISSVPGKTVSLMKWKTNCNHVRQQAYQVVIKAEDDNSDLSLVEISNFNIKVLGPPPENLELAPGGTSINLSWSPGECSNVTAYRIYRRNGYIAYVPDSCQNGVPSFTGYESIGETADYNDTTFIDNGGGSGLVQGIDYCYMVVALYEGDCESIPSDEECSSLIQGVPLITNVSVRNTDAVNGSVYLAWMKPRDLDTIPANGPYQYRIYRAEGVWGTSFSMIHSYNSPDLLDTSFVDTLINTLDLAYTYKVELYNDNSGQWELVAPPGSASTVFLTFVPADNKLEIRCRKNVPWVNTEYVFYRKNEMDGFDSVGVSVDTVFVDSGLINGKTYCYIVKTTGSYHRHDLPASLVNYSHEACGIPEDNEPPCPPVLQVASICDSLYNSLVWTNPNNYCADDVESYKIYFIDELDADLILIGSGISASDTTFRHYLNESLAGCYAVTAIDSNANESSYSNIVCVDSCSYYEIPNVFTPNGDDKNDRLIARTNPFVEKIDIKIYSRSGVLVFKTEDPAINWDGYNIKTRKLVSPGVYYYMCDVYERRLTGIEPRHYSGFVHVITDKNAKKNIE